MDFGSPNPATRALRPVIPLSRDLCKVARRLRKLHPAWALADIARAVGGDVEAVRLALSTLRTPLATPRAVLNVSPWARAAVRSAARPGEPTWATVDRLLAAAVPPRR